MNFFHNTIKYAHYRSDEAAVFDLIGRDRSVKHVVAFAGDRTDRGGEMSTMHKHLLAPTDFATSLSIGSFRFVLVSFFGDFNADRVLSARSHKFTPKG
jgi:hypothetical protein